jgi:hypothetical protein
MLRSLDAIVQYTTALRKHTGLSKVADLDISLTVTPNDRM